MFVRLWSVTVTPGESSLLDAPKIIPLAQNLVHKSQEAKFHLVPTFALSYSGSHGACSSINLSSVNCDILPKEIRKLFII